MRNETVAPLDAPSRRKDIAVGITPQEHNGKGMPNSAAYKTDLMLFCARYWLYIFAGMNACIIPARRKPNSRYGDIWFIKFSISVIAVFCVLR